MPASKLSLVSITVAVFTIQISLSSRFAEFDLFSNSLLLWTASGFLIWKKRDFLLKKASFTEQIIGAFFVLSVFIGSFIKASDSHFIRLTPLLSVVGILLLASGFKGLKQYWQVLFLLCFLIPDPIILSQWLNLSEITTQFSSMLLSLEGFTVVRNGAQINLLMGSGKVGPVCSGVKIILHLLSIGTFFIFGFSTNWMEKILFLVGAVVIGFLTNAVRIAILIPFIGSPDSKQFDYWHEGLGSHLFSVVSVLLFVTFCFLLHSYFANQAVVRTEND